MADDYQSLAGAVSPAGLSFDSINLYMARFPIAALVSYGIFRSGVFEHTWLPLIGFFAAYAIGVALLVRYVILATGLGEILEGRFQDRQRHFGVDFKTLVLVLLTTLILFPTLYEVWYWPSNMIYSLGALLLGMAFFSNSTGLKILLLMSCYLVSETFVIPSLCLLTLPSVFAVLNRENSKLRDVMDPGVIKAVGVWVLAGLIFLLVRLGLTIWFPVYKYGLSWNLLSVLFQMINGLLSLFSIHFYKVLWAPTLVFWLVLGTFVWKSMALKHCHPTMWAVFLLYVIVSILPYGLLAYSATRALFGAQLLVILILAWTFLNVAARKPDRSVVFLCSALLLLFLSHQFLILGIKSSNSKVLKIKEQALVQQMTRCLQPCQITLEELDSGLQRDWVLGRSFWKDYARWVKEKHFPEKNIEFIIK